MMLRVGDDDDDGLEGEGDDDDERDDDDDSAVEEMMMMVSAVERMMMMVSAVMEGSGSKVKSMGGRQAKMRKTDWRILARVWCPLTTLGETPGAPH